MKLIRFSKIILKKLGLFILMVLIGASIIFALMGIAWCIGWVAYSIGVDLSSSDPKINENPYLPAGVVIIFWSVFTGCVLCGIVSAIKTIYKTWKEA